MFEDAHDNMVFTVPETGDQLIFHRKTWLCTIYGILTRYLGFAPELAYDMIKNAPLCSDAGINYHSVGMLCHDEEYHWAMILAYGEGYWHKGHTVDKPQDYYDWGEKYRNDNNLKPYTME